MNINDHITVHFYQLPDKRHLATVNVVKQDGEELINAEIKPSIDEAGEWAMYYVINNVGREYVLIDPSG